MRRTDNRRSDPPSAKCGAENTQLQAACFGRESASLSGSLAVSCFRKVVACYWTCGVKPPAGGLQQETPPILRRDAKLQTVKAGNRLFDPRRRGECTCVTWSGSRSPGAC